MPTHAIVYALLLLTGYFNVVISFRHKCLPEYTVYWDVNQCFCAIDDIEFECEGPPAEPSERPILDKRIVGGDSVAFINHPYMLALEMREELMCGATIISTKWAVTAAHCVEGFHLSGMKLRGHTSQREKGGYLYKVIAAIIHHGFNDETFACDIALLRSNKLFRKNDAIKLPKPNDRLAVGTMVTVVGWGNTEENGTMSMTLRDVRVPIVSYKECRQAYGDVITINMYCAGYPEGLKDACQADSGGPLVHGEYLVGIVSFGQGCARPKTPGVYTRVSAMREWIKKQINI